MNWVEALAFIKNEGSSTSSVLVTVLETRGSSPRATGSKMVITTDTVFDTIGGGALEYEVTNIARELLTNPKKIQHRQAFNLGKDLKQCCGGIVNVFFEVFHASDFNIVIFGAGHIGKALIKILEDIECQVKWFDSRADQLPETCLPHIRKHLMDKPEVAVDSCSKNSYFLIATHDHGLDQQLCEAVLSQGNGQYCGLIGSTTKSQKFKRRMLKKDFSQKELKQLSCPMGLSSIKTKKPMEIAVSVVAKLLKMRGKNNNDFNCS